MIIYRISLIPCEIVYKNLKILGNTLEEGKMDKTLKDADEFYKPKIKQNVLIDGIAAETIAKNSTGKILQRGFITSLQKDFEILARNILQPFYPNQLNHINNALIIIKKDNTAKIYSKFPLSVLTNAKGDIKKGELVTEENVFDMIELEFRDDLYEISIEDGE